jgi:hypothetical protein
MEKLLQIIYIQSQVLEFFYLGQAVTALHSLHISNKKLKQRCQCDIMATGGYVSRVWGSSSEGETGTV